MLIFVLELQKLIGSYLPWWDITSDASDSLSNTGHKTDRLETRTHTTMVTFQNKNVVFSDLHEYYSFLGKKTLCYPPLLFFHQQTNT